MSKQIRKPTIVLSDSELVERITGLAEKESRTRAQVLRKLLVLGLSSYDFTGSILCPGKARCQRPACERCRPQNRAEAAAGSVVRFPRPSA